MTPNGTNPGALGLFLDGLRPGRDVVFATGTPVSNTICEAYVMLRYLAPPLLERAGIHHFDAWAATFTRRVTGLELSPDGSSYRMRTRFHFENVPELVKLFRTVADVQMAEPYDEPSAQAAEDGVLLTATRAMRIVLSTATGIGEDGSSHAD